MLVVTVLFLDLVMIHWIQWHSFRKKSNTAVVQWGLTLSFDKIFTSQYIRSVYCSLKDWQMNPDKNWFFKVKEMSPLQPLCAVSFFLSVAQITCYFVLWREFWQSNSFKSLWSSTINVGKKRKTRLIPTFCIEGCIRKILDGLVTFSHVSSQSLFTNPSYCQWIFLHYSMLQKFWLLMDTVL